MSMRPRRRDGYWRRGRKDTSDVEDGQISSDDEYQPRRRRRPSPRRRTKSKAPPKPIQDQLLFENVSESSNDSVIILPTPSKPEPTILTISDEETENVTANPETDRHSIGDGGDDLEILQLRRNVLEVMLTKENTKGTQNTAVLAEDNYEEAVMDVSPADGQQLTDLVLNQEEIQQDAFFSTLTSNPRIEPFLPTSTWRQRRGSESSGSSESWASSIPLPPQPPVGSDSGKLTQSEPRMEPFRLRNTFFNPSPPLILPFDTDERQNSPFTTMFGASLPLRMPFFGNTPLPVGVGQLIPNPGTHDYNRSRESPANSFRLVDETYRTSLGLIPNSENGDIDMRTGSGLAHPVPPGNPFLAQSSFRDFSFTLPSNQSADSQASTVRQPCDTGDPLPPHNILPPSPRPFTFNMPPQFIPRPHPSFSSSATTSPALVNSPPESLGVSRHPELPLVTEQTKENEPELPIDTSPSPTVPCSKDKAPPRPPAIRLTKLGTNTFAPESSPEQTQNGPTGDSHGVKRPLIEQAQTVEREHSARKGTEKVPREGERKRARTDTVSPSRHARRPKTAPTRRDNQSPERRRRSRTRSKSPWRYSFSFRSNNRSPHLPDTEWRPPHRTPKASSTEVGEKSRADTKNSKAALPRVSKPQAPPTHNVVSLVPKSNPPPTLAPANPLLAPPTFGRATPEPTRVTFTPSTMSPLDDEDQLRARLLIDISKTRLGLPRNSTQEPPNILVKISQPNRNEPSGGNQPTRCVYQSPHVPSSSNPFSIRSSVVNNQRFPPFKKTIYNHSAFQTKPDQRSARYQVHNPFAVTTKPIRPIIINVRGETSSDESDQPGGRTVTFVDKKSPAKVPPRSTTSRSVQVKNKESASPTGRSPSNGIARTSSTAIPGNVSASFDMLIADARRAAVAKRNKEIESQRGAKTQLKDLIPPVVKHLSLAAQAEYTELVGRIQEKTAAGQSIKNKQSQSTFSTPITSPQKGQQVAGSQLNSDISPIHPRVKAIKPSIQSGNFFRGKRLVCRTRLSRKRSEEENGLKSGAVEECDIFGSVTLPGTNRDNHPDKPNLGLTGDSAFVSENIDRLESVYDSSFTSQDSDRLVIDETGNPHDDDSKAIPLSPGHPGDRDVDSSLFIQDNESLVLGEAVHDCSFISEDSDRLVIDEAVHDCSFISEDSDCLVIDETVHLDDDDSKAIPSSPGHTCDLDPDYAYVGQHNGHLVIDEAGYTTGGDTESIPQSQSQKNNFHSSNISQGGDGKVLVIDEPVPIREPYLNGDTRPSTRLGVVDISIVSQNGDELAIDNTVHGDNEYGNRIFGSFVIKQESHRLNVDETIETRDENSTVITGSPDQRSSRTTDSCDQKESEPLMTTSGASHDDDKDGSGILDAPNSKNDADILFASEDGHRLGADEVLEDDNCNSNADGSDFHLNVSKIISPPLSDGEMDGISPISTRTITQPGSFQQDLIGVSGFYMPPLRDFYRENVTYDFKYRPGPLEDVDEQRKDNVAAKSIPTDSSEKKGLDIPGNGEQEQENQELVGTPTVPFSAANVLFPRVETSTQEQEHKELLLRERLLKLTLQRRFENSELKLSLRNAEGRLVDKRLQCVSKLDGLNEKLKKLSSVKLRQTKLQEDRHFYLRQLAKVDRELELNETKGEKLETVVRARTSSLLMDQADYVHLTESCIEFGGKLNGIRYLLPKTGLGDYERKYAEARKCMSKIKLSINLPDNPRIPQPPPVLPSPSTSPLSTLGKMALPTYRPRALLPSQRLRHTPFTFHSYVENDSGAESNEEAENDDGPRYQLPSGRLRGYLGGNGEGASDDNSYQPYVSLVTGRVHREYGLGSDPSIFPLLADPSTKIGEVSEMKDKEDVNPEFCLGEMPTSRSGHRSNCEFADRPPGTDSNEIQVSLGHDKGELN